MSKAKSVTMFKGIKNLISSGPGMTKMPDVHKHSGPASPKIDVGAVKPRSGGMKMASSSPKPVTGSGHKGIHIGVRAQASTKRDAAKVAKP